jgi:subtilisin family serine protease
VQTTWQRALTITVCTLAVLGVSFPRLGFGQTVERVLPDRKEAAPRNHPRISSSLSQVGGALLDSRATPNGAQGNIDGTPVQVYVHLTDYDADYVSRLVEKGAKIEIVEASVKIIQARIPPGSLESIAELPFVRFIDEPDRPVSNVGSKNTEADGVLQSNLARSTLGVTGTGIRVGVVQLGFKGRAASQESGDLPAGASFFSTRADGSVDGTSGEGTAMLELIHDIAPGAQLFGVSFNTGLEFVAAVNFLADVAGGPNSRRGTSGGVDIIVDDISFFNAGPYDGSSFVSQAVTAAVGRGVAYFTSAGNHAQRHWRGLYSACPGSDFHRFNVPSCGPGMADEVLDIRLPANSSFQALLQWNDQFGGSGNNYDLRLFDRDTGELLTAADGVTGGRDVQSGTQFPLERITFTNSGMSTRNLGIVLENVGGAAQPRQLELYLTGSVVQEQYVVSDHSIPNVADAKKVISLGAVDWQTPNSIETYSSRGPTLDGRLKPEAVAPDCVSVTGNGDFPTTFCGTSASAPHAAAVAALLLSSTPSLSPSQLYGALIAPTVELGAPFPNNTFGFGRIDALASTQLAKNLPTFGLNVAKTGSGLLDWTISFNYPNPPFGAPTLFGDAYFGYLRPDGILTFLRPDLSQSTGNLNNPQTFAAFLGSVDVDPGTLVPPMTLFSTPIVGPPGQYVAFFGGMPTGAAPSGNLWSVGSTASNGGSNVQGIAIAPFFIP